MTRFENMVKIVAEEYREDCTVMDCDINELFKAYQLEKEDMIEEFCTILNKSEYAKYVTDECEIFDDDGKIKTFRQFSAAVKKYQF